MKQPRVIEDFLSLEECKLLRNWAFSLMWILTPDTQPDDNGHLKWNGYMQADVPPELLNSVKLQAAKDSQAYSKFVDRVQDAFGLREGYICTNSWFLAITPSGADGETKHCHEEGYYYTVMQLSHNIKDGGDLLLYGSDGEVSQRITYKTGRAMGFPGEMFHEPLSSKDDMRFTLVVVFKKI